ncbi:MAG: tetratricopeptide repeat protein [FCB group bacterium]|nr:tetratricopeptide repeat protein [FCB group bacterium]
MESYRLKSKVSISEKEFLVQTVNDVRQNSVVSSLFVDGEILEISRYPHSGDVSENDIVGLVKDTHDQKKSELEHLLHLNQEILNSGDTETMYHLGTAFYYKRMYEEAVCLLDSLLTIKPKHHQASNCLGLARMEMGDFDGAVRALAVAVELRPAFADYHNNYGEALLEAGFCRRAVEELETALKKNIYYADAHFNLGIAYIVNAISREDFDMYNNLIEKTTDIFNRAVLITPDFKSSEYEEACELLRSGDLPRALNLFKAVRNGKRELGRSGSSSFHVRLLLSPERGNETTIDDRIRSLKAEIDKNPNYVDLRHELALCYLQLSQISWSRAITEFDKAVEINPRLTKSKLGRERAAKYAESLKTVVAEITAGNQND